MPPANRVLFLAFSPTTGTELWESDGTPAGTVLLKDIFPGTIGTPAAQGFTQFGGQALFAATDPTHGTELWATDGTTGGTFMLKDIDPGSTGGFIEHANGTSDLTTLRPAGSKMVFLGDDGATGQELWVTDGTSDGTFLLKDIRAGSQPSNPGFFASFGDKQLFTAIDGVHLADNDGFTGQELWITDGTVAGTKVLADLNPDLFSSGSPRNFTDLGASGRAVFSAAVGTPGRELWVTDGTAAGTVLLKDINPAAFAGSDPSKPVPVGTTGSAVFAATNAATQHQSPFGGQLGTELWVTDGTPGNTFLLKTFSGGSDSGSASDLGGATPTTFGNLVLFGGTDNGVAAIWASDGTVAGTVKISTDGVTSNGFTPMGAKDLFWNGTGLGASPWITDGTPAGTFQLLQTSNLADQGETFGFGVIGGKAIFNAVNTSVRAHTLWVTDGTKAGTFDLGISITNPQGFATIGDKVIFQATDTTHHTELWISDGTFLGTSLLKDINTVNNASFAPFGSSSPTAITAVALACFAAGTRIETSKGATRVEDLREGDLVVTASGERRPIRWIGQRLVDVTSHQRPEDVRPVRIAPHAFGENLPHAALMLSPDHAIYSDGVLIPVKHLVNGDSIVQIPVASIRYFHLELSSHDVVFAEGLPVESYLDTGDRDNFSHGDGPVRLFPNFGCTDRASYYREAHGCAPLRITGPEVAAVRERLTLRAYLAKPLSHAGHSRKRSASEP